MLHAKIVFGAAGPNSGPAVLPNAPCENRVSDHKHEFPICGSTERSTQNPCFGFQTRTLDLHFYRTLHAKTVFRTTSTNSRFPVLPNAPRENRVLGYKHELSTCRFTERSTRKPWFSTSSSISRLCLAADFLRRSTRKPNFDLASPFGYLKF